VYGALDIGVLHAGETNYTQLPGDTLEKKVVLLRRQRSRRRHDQRQLAISEPDRALIVRPASGWPAPPAVRPVRG
jgi:hypothetical protein